MYNYSHTIVLIILIILYDEHTQSLLQRNIFYQGVNVEDLI